LKKEFKKKKKKKRKKGQNEQLNKVDCGNNVG
jgi:hypothetical protein